MLAKKFRLPSSVAFQNATFFKEQEFTVKAQKNNEECSRFGFIVAKKIDKRAFVRNRLKRMVRSCIENKWLKHKGKDILFVMRPGIKESSREIVQRKVDIIMKGLFA